MKPECEPDCLQPPDRGSTKPAEGERSPESDYGFHTWTGHIHAGCTGCIPPAVCCGACRGVYGQLRAAHVQHTGDFHAVHAVHAVHAGSRRVPYGSAR